MYINKKVLFISLSYFFYSQAGSVTTNNDRIAIIQWLYRMENRLDKIDNIDNKIESYQAILDVHKNALEDDRYIKNCILLPPAVACFSYTALTVGGITGLSFFRHLDNDLQAIRVIGIISAFFGLIFYLPWSFDRENTIHCIEADKRIIAKLQQLRNKFDRERSLENNNSI